MNDEVKDPGEESSSGQSEHDKAMSEAADKDIVAATREKREEGNDQQIPDFIPEKFRSAENPYEAMAKSYAELEKKLGMDKDDGKGSEEGEHKDEEKPDESNSDNTGDDNKGDDSEGTIDFQKYYGEYSDKGELSEDSYKELADKGIPKEVVDTYIKGAQAQTDAALATAYDIAGGEEAFNEMVAWAETDLPDAELAKYNKQLETDHELAVRGLYDKYVKSGKAPVNRVRGDGKPDVRDAFTPFKSQEEVTQAMKDRRYATDPAYRKEVEARLSISDNETMGAIEHSHVSTTHQFGG